MWNTEKIVELDIGCVPEAGVSGAVLLQTERSTLLTFNAMRKASGGRYEDAGIALVEFDICHVTKFGYPNDEAWSGIPRTRNLSYGAYEVLHSPWIREITELNRCSFPKTPDDQTNRHFLFLFHDSSFECIARSLKVELFPRPYSAVFDRMSKRVLSE